MTSGKTIALLGRFFVGKSGLGATLMLPGWLQCDASVAFAVRLNCVLSTMRSRDFVPSYLVGGVDGR